MTVTAKRIRQAAPKKTGTLRKSIRSRFEKSYRGKPQVSKVGINVGKQKRTSKGMKSRLRAPHAHLVALGTVVRTRKTLGGKFSYIKRPTRRQLTTGRMPGNKFLKPAFENARPEAMAKMRERARLALIRETQRLKKGR